MRTVAVILTLVIIFALAAGCSQPAPVQPAVIPPTSVPIPPTTIASTPAPTPAQTLFITPESTPMESGNAVVITGYAFNPADITVNAGTTVRWTNEEQGVERLQINNGLKSQVLTTGESWTQIFNQAGVYNYSSMIHPSMQGSVTVV